MAPRRTPAAPVDLAALRRELEVPDAFPAEVVRAAEAAARRGPLGDERVDARDVPLVTVDPPGSMDLDQALALADRPGGGWTVHYAIADVAAFVVAGDPVDVEARRRGATRYLPDGRAPLHPPVLGEGAMSLLPDVDRPAVLWRFDVEGGGQVATVDARRALVRSRSRLDYASLQAQLAAGTAPEAARALPEIGPARQALAAARGAIELGIASQEVVPGPDGGWALELRAPLPVEAWNAQLSLLTGMEAARIMLAAGIGFLRTLPAPDPADVARLRVAAPALGVDWPAGATPGEVLRTLDGQRPGHAAFVDLAADLLRGAGYLAFDGAPPEDPAHAGVGAPYAHVTAPIRRLADRFATEVCLSVVAGRPVPAWVREALAELPEAMAAADRRAAAAERAAIDLVEAALLAPRLGEEFPAVVVDLDDRGRATIVLDDPPVRARCEGDDLALGSRISARLVAADPGSRTVAFSAG